MRDDFLGSDWAAGHWQVSRTMRGVLRATAAGMRRLQARQFDAPWRRDTATRRPPRDGLNDKPHLP